MKIAYCSNCGMRLNIMRKALPKFGTIIDVIEYHECSDEMQELDLTPVNIPQFTPTEGKKKFVEKLNDLKPHGLVGSVSTMDLRDRRVEQFVKSSAPPTVLDQIKSMTPSTPEGDLED